MENIRDLLLKKEKENKIVINTIEGLMEMDINEFIKQPTEGLLYDLNRDRVTVLTWVEKDQKWINDFAVCLVITKLKQLMEK